MIKRRDFFHQRIKYSFNWNQKHFKEKLGLNHENEELKRMEEFFKMVYQGTIPNKLFNSREIQRISKFKIRGLKAAFLNSFSKKLIRSGKIKKYDSNSKLPNYARKVFENFQKNQLNKIPGHDPILKNILIRDQDSIAIEVPIWNKINNEYITGHIDLVQINENVIKIVDYKPEGNFLYSLPQVATYGFLFKKILNVNDLKCLTFNKKEVWEYDPDILITDIKQYLISQKIKERIWEKFL